MCGNLLMPYLSGLGHVFSSLSATPNAAITGVCKDRSFKYIHDGHLKCINCAWRNINIYNTSPKFCSAVNPQIAILWLYNVFIHKQNRYTVYIRTIFICACILHCVQYVKEIYILPQQKIFALLSEGFANCRITLLSSMLETYDIPILKAVNFVFPMVLNTIYKYIFSYSVTTDNIRPKSNTGLL